MAAVEAEVLSSQQFVDILDYEFSGDNATVLRKRALIEAYREEGSIYHAALTTQVNRKTVYRWIDNDPQFALALEESKEDCYDKAETSVYKKALAGDSLLLMFYLKAHRHKFRDKVTIDVEVVKNEIEERMNQLNLRQLPATTTTQFLDVASGLQAESLNSSIPAHFPSPPQQIQKEMDSQPLHNPATDEQV